MFVQPVYAIRIGLITGVNKLNVGASTYANIIDVKTNKVLYTIDPMRNYVFKPYGNSIVIKVAGNFYTLNTDEVVIRPIYQGFVSAKNKWYRGTFVIRNINGNLKRVKIMFSLILSYLAHSAIQPVVATKKQMKL